MKHVSVTLVRCPTLTCLPKRKERTCPYTGLYVCVYSAHVTSPNGKQPDIYYWRMGLQTVAQPHHRILLSSKKEQITVHTVTLP